jgi:glycosyltransferase involved in cell wall biosynthesis
VSRRLLIAGVALGGDGYPNAENTIALLRAAGPMEVHDLAHWLPTHVRLWHLSRGPLLRRVALALYLGGSALAQAIRLLCCARRRDVAYVPYPAPLTLWWLSFVPRRWRPRCIADAYISLWDSTFRDRAMGSPAGRVSALVKRFERRGLKAASVVLTDTEANRTQLISDFALAPERVRSLPLAINDRPFRSAPATESNARHSRRVLFVGTLVPLHGIDVVLGAAARLRQDLNVEFRLVGDGQQSDLVESFLAADAPANFTWEREWKTLAGIAQEIAQADVCLGVFGGSAKASRVLPFKLYYALAAGKAIVTQAEYSLPSGVPPVPAKLVAVGTDDAAEQLAQMIRLLLDDDTERAALEQSARAYFQRHLSGDAVISEWRHLLRCD